MRSLLYTVVTVLQRGVLFSLSSSLHDTKSKSQYYKETSLCIIVTQ